MLVEALIARALFERHVEIVHLLTMGRADAGGSGLTGPQARRLVDALQVRGRREFDDPASITGREHDILAAIEAGLSVKQTAQRLDISPRTVENTQRLLFRKLGVRSRSQAVARALEAGLLGTRPNPGAVVNDSVIRRYLAIARREWWVVLQAVIVVGVVAGLLAHHNQAASTYQANAQLYVEPAVGPDGSLPLVTGQDFFGNTVTPLSGPLSSALARGIESQGVGRGREDAR